VTYPQLLAAYRTHRVMLAASPATDPLTSVPRHALESLACGTPVVASPSPGLDALAGEVVRVAVDAGDTGRHLEGLLGAEEDRQRLGHLGYRLVHERHTHGRRLVRILGEAGLPPPTACDRPPVSVVLATSRPSNIERALEGYARQAYPERELWLVLNNNAFDLDAVRRLTDGLPNANVVLIEGRTTLGESINHVLDRCAGRYVAKMDDDDHYGERYLADLVLAARFSGAEITGKARYFTYLERSGELAERVLGPEHDHVAIVCGATLLIDRDVFRTLRFSALPRGTDSVFLRDATDEGCRVYSTDKYNFVLVRRPDPRLHTWQIAEDEFRERCVDIRPGLDLRRVML
jgi:hypothetical protein